MAVRMKIGRQLRRPRISARSFGRSLSLLKGLLYQREGRVELGAYVGRDNDDRNRNAGRDEAICEGRRAGVVFHETSKSFHVLRSLLDPTVRFVCGAWDESNQDFEMPLE